MEKFFLNRCEMSGHVWQGDDDSLFSQSYPRECLKSLVENFASRSELIHLARPRARVGQSIKRLVERIFEPGRYASAQEILLAWQPPRETVVECLRFLSHYDCGVEQIRGEKLYSRLLNASELRRIEESVQDA